MTSGINCGAVNYTLPLQIKKAHMFIQAGDKLLLLDTGAPSSFCSSSPLTIAGQRFELAKSYMGLTQDTLSSFVGFRTSGLLGADVLGKFDLIIDAPSSTITLTTDKIMFAGHAVPLESFMGIPIISVVLGSATYRMFFDTGAQISYLQDDSLTDYPPAGQVIDFYPGLGQFATETHTVDIQVGESTFSLRCGRLPDLLGMTLMMAGTQGILGNQFLQERKVGYFPRRKTLIL